MNQPLYLTLISSEPASEIITRLFIKYYSPLHVSSIKCSSSGVHSCIHAAYGTVPLYKSSWWPVDMQLAAYRQAIRNSYRE